jgi:hypothetical protein
MQVHPPVATPLLDPTAYLDTLLSNMFFPHDERPGLTPLEK